MINLDIIKKYIMTYAGQKYKKPIDNNDSMMQLMLADRGAREQFVKLGEEVLKQFPNYTMYKCTIW